VFTKEAAAPKVGETGLLAATREQLASIFAEAVQPVVEAFSAANKKRDGTLEKAIALFKEDTQRSRDAIVEEKLAERMAVERARFVEAEKEATADLTKTVEKQKKSIEELKTKVLRATEKIGENDVQWRKSAREQSLKHAEAIRMLRNDVAVKIQTIARLRGERENTARAAEEKAKTARPSEERDKTARPEKRGREQNDSRDHGSIGNKSRATSRQDQGEGDKERRERDPSDSRDRESLGKKKGTPGRQDQGGGEQTPTKTRRAPPVNALRDQGSRDAEPTTTPSDVVDLGWPINTRRGKDTSRGVEGGSLEPSEDVGQEPMLLTQVLGPFTTGRTGKAWGTKTGEEDESISTVHTVEPTGVVDLMNSSSEVGGAAVAVGTGEDEVDYEPLSSDEEIVVPEVVLPLTAEQKRARKSLNDKNSKARRKAEALEAEALAKEVAVKAEEERIRKQEAHDYAEKYYQAATAKEALDKAEALNKAEEEKTREQFVRDQASLGEAEEKRATDRWEREQCIRGEVSTAPSLLDKFRGNKPGTLSMIKKAAPVIEEDEEEEEEEIGEVDEGSGDKA